jgi:ABC-type multidrug transport system ATPase subunit
MYSTLLIVLYHFIYVDNRSTKIVQDALNQVSKDRTTIIVAHRLTTIRDAHLILVFNKGNVVEYGTHAELMQIKNGIYRALTAQPDQEEEEDTNIERQLSNDSSGKFKHTKQLIFNENDII